MPRILGSCLVVCVWTFPAGHCRFLLVPPAVVEPLTAFLQEHQYFGLLPNQVHVCPNEVRPPLVNEDFKVGYWVDGVLGCSLGLVWVE